MSLEKTLRMTGAIRVTKTWMLSRDGSRGSNFADAENRSSLNGSSSLISNVPMMSSRVGSAWAIAYYR